MTSSALHTTHQAGSSGNVHTLYSGSALIEFQPEFQLPCHIFNNFLLSFVANFRIVFQTGPKPLQFIIGNIYYIPVFTATFPADGVPV
jgi:hypothetical protein